MEQKEKFWMKKLTYYLLISSLLVSSVYSTNHLTVSAESTSEIQQKIDKLEEEQKEVNERKNDLKDETEETQKKIEENEQQQASVQEQINNIDHQLTTTRYNIEEKENEIEETNQEIEELTARIKQLEKEIKELEERIERRDKLLKDRLRSIQQNGGEMSYIEVIFGSKSFSEFISRTISINKIMDSDKEIMEQQKKDKEKLQSSKIEVEESKTSVEEEKANLESQKSELVALKDQLNVQMIEKENLMTQLEEEQEHLEEYKVSIEDEETILANQAAAIEKAKQLAQQEKVKLNQLSQSKANSNSSTTSKQSSGSGIISWPASPSTVSSPFGQRWGKLHRGLDFAVSTGTPIKTVAPGVVIQTNTEYDGQMNGYGNVILIAHSINGTTYTTLYAHLNSISVSAGSTVNEGQVIGESGNSGNSTGPHLHFELHKGGWNGDSNAVNPRSYLPG